VRSDIAFFQGKSDGIMKSSLSIRLDSGNEGEQNMDERTIYKEALREVNRGEEERSRRYG